MNKLEVAIISEIGGRDAMEDTYYFEDVSTSTGRAQVGSEVFCAVFDGHGGTEAAEYARDCLDDKFFRELKANKTPEEAFVVAFEEVSRELAHQESGTTALTYYLKKKKLYYANAGDCRLLVMTNGQINQLTKDHRLDNPEERKRIISRGGEIMEPYAMKGAIGLMPTRTLGDQYFKDIGIIATPETGNYKLQPTDNWILAATDGLFDFIENEEIAELLLDYDDSREAAKALKNEMLVSRSGSDNLTFILVKL